MQEGSEENQIITRFFRQKMLSDSKRLKDNWDSSHIQNSPR